MSVCLFLGAGVNNGALIREVWMVISVQLIQNPLVALAPCGYLDDSLFGDGAGPPLAGVEPLFDGEAAAMGLEPLHQQVVDGSKVVVAFVLQRLEDDRQHKWQRP